MRDIPMFTTRSGVASLTLKEIPYSGAAYVKLQDASDIRAFLCECVDFCRAVGAARVYASGHPVLEEYPFHTALWRMSASRQRVGETDASLFPVQEKTLEQWRSVYNEKMKKVPNASFMTKQDGQKMITEGTGYFVHREGKLLGIGMASGDTVQNVISLAPGAGKDVLCALVGVLPSDTVFLEAASTNEKAIHLYEAHGFLKTAELSRWFRLY